MRWMASIVAALSLLAGIISAVTAYLPRLDLGDEQLVGLRLAAPAGVRTDEQGKRVPIVTAGTADAPTVLTAELLRELRAAGVKRVRVREFALARWRESWLFGVACVGLMGSAVGGRLVSRRASNGSGGPGAGDPAGVLGTIRAKLEGVQGQVRGAADDRERMRAILDGLGRLQREDIPGFVALRPVLLGRLGVAGHARLMGEFAAGERQVNRAWSAAADGLVDEAVECLDRAVEVIRRTPESLGNAV